MKYLCLFYFAPDAFSDLSQDDMRRIDDATIEHDHKLRASGHLLIASPLADIGTQTVIDRRRRPMVTDGPYAETKEVVGGLVLVEARDMDEVQSLFADDPIAPYCSIHIRPLLETHRHSQTGQSRPEFRPD